MLVICRDTDVMLLLVHFIPAQSAEMWMISGTAKKRKCSPIHALSERLAKPMGITCWASTRSQVVTRQRLVAMASSLAGKLFRIIRISCRGLVVMENSHQLNNLYVTCTAHLSNKPSTMPDSNSSVRASLVWRCYPQPERQRRPGTSHRTRQLSNKDLAAGRPGAYRHPFSHRHLCMDDGVRLLESCMDKTASYSRCVSRASHLWMQD